MKNEKFAAAKEIVKERQSHSANWGRRVAVICVALWGAVANFSLFTFTSTLTFAQKVQKGKASYYSKKWTGRKTANGDRLHHDSMTCAHKTHPFGTLLKVTNPDNGKVVIVRVNDRGPYSRGRIIDLSWGAARELGILAKGVAKVEIEKFTGHLSPPAPEVPLIPVKWGADSFLISLPFLR